MTGLSNLPPGCTDMDIERAAGWKATTKVLNPVGGGTKRGCNQDKMPTVHTTLKAGSGDNAVSIVRGRWKDI